MYNNKYSSVFINYLFKKEKEKKKKPAGSSKIEGRQRTVYSKEKVRAVILSGSITRPVELFLFSVSGSFR